MQIKANTPTKEWYVIITVATAKDKTTAKDNTGAGDELLKMVKQKRVCNINNN